MASDTEQTEEHEVDLFQRLAEQLMDLDRIAADGDIITVTVSGQSFLARLGKVEHAVLQEGGVQPVYITRTPDVCGHCWKSPADGHAAIGQIRYCHGEGGRTCYEIASEQAAF